MKLAWIIVALGPVAPQTSAEPPVQYPSAQACAEALSEKLVEYMEDPAWNARYQGWSCARVLVPEEDQ